MHEGSTIRQGEIPGTARKSCEVGWPGGIGAGTELRQDPTI